MSELGPAGEESWNVIARKRRERDRLEAEIQRDTPQAVADAKAAGVKVPELAKLWGVTPQWIYMRVPARTSKGPA